MSDEASEGGAAAEYADEAFEMPRCIPRLFWLFLLRIPPANAPEAAALVAPPAPALPS